MRRSPLAIALLVLIPFAASWGQAPTPPENVLHIVSVPAGASIYIDGVDKGFSPVDVVNPPRGLYTITAQQDGYYDANTMVFYIGGQKTVALPMIHITAVLDLSVSPKTARVSFGGRLLPAGAATVPYGTYDLTAQAFGYQDYHTSVDVRSQAPISMDVSLNPAPFAFSGIFMPGRTMNPSLWFGLGNLKMSFDVSGPGQGEVSILDSGSSEVFHLALPAFKTWSQSFSWDLRDSSGNIVPDGNYLLVLSGTGAGGDKAGVEIPFSVKK
jgi:hypothetical protein